MIRRRLSRLPGAAAPGGSLADEAALAPPDEVPAAFFASFLGWRMKYSCGLWPAADLDAADAAMLELICERAGVAEGMRVLDLGAGWGALTFHLAERGMKVTAVTRSQAQASFIGTRASALGLHNVEVVCADARTVELAGFDRVFAIEMIEHVRNPGALLARVAGWLAPGGKVFVQAIAHRDRAMPHFLPWAESGVMLSDPLLDSFECGLAATGRWTVDGLNYRRTIKAWSLRLARSRAAAMDALGGSWPRYRRWRAFLVGCEEMFGWDEGRAFRVVHRLFERI